MNTTTLAQQYASGTITPEQVVNAIYDRIERESSHPVWISLAPRAFSIARAKALGETKDRSSTGDLQRPICAIEISCAGDGVSLWLRVGRPIEWRLVYLSAKNLFNTMTVFRSSLRSASSL